MYPIIDSPQNYTAALYLRLSKEDANKKENTDTSESIKNQRALLERYAKEQKIRIYDVYIDDGFTGTSAKRPELNRMLEDIANKRINMVITKDMSRLSRNYIDAGHFIELFFPEQQIRYISLLDGIDTGSRDYTGDLAPFKAILNDMYAKDISRKISSVKHDKQQKGLFIGGKAPYGYKKSPTVKNVIVVDEPAAKTVRYIFHLASEGKSCREIAMILNDERVATPASYANINLSVKGSYSGKWSSERISFMLQNEVYIGSMVQGRVKKASYKSQKCIKLPREEWKVVENTHEAIIDKETFYKVAELIKSRQNTRHRTYDFLLKGLIFCHECKKPLGVSKRTLADGSEVFYFICRTYQRFTKNSACTCHCARVDEVTRLVLSEIQEICSFYSSNCSFDELTAAANKMLKERKKKQGNDIASFKAKIDAIQIKTDKTYNDYLSGLIEKEDFQRIYTALKKQQTFARERIEEIAALQKEDISFDVKKIKALTDGLINAEEYSRDFLVSLVERIELSENKELHIYFKFNKPDSVRHLQ